MEVGGLGDGTLGHVGAALGQCHLPLARLGGYQLLACQLERPRLLVALELVKNKKTRERFADADVGMRCREHCFRNGLVMRAVGDTMIISPPLVISEEQIDELIGKVRLCLDATAKDVRG